MILCTFPDKLISKLVLLQLYFHWFAIDRGVTDLKLLDEYYKFKGWNLEGLPTRETLNDLGLDYVTDDFWQRGMLKEEPDQAAQDASSQGSKP